MLQCIFDYHCQRDGLLDREGFIAHFTPTKNYAAKTKHSFFTLCEEEEESAENKTKGTQNLYRGLGMTQDAVFQLVTNSHVSCSCFPDRIKQ